MIQRPPSFGAFEFVVLSTLRAQQLIRGCTPRVDIAGHKKSVIAQLEIAQGKVVQLPFLPKVVAELEIEPALPPLVPA